MELQDEILEPFSSIPEIVIDRILSNFVDRFKIWTDQIIFECYTDHWYKTTCASAQMIINEQPGIPHMHPSLILTTNFHMWKELGQQMNWHTAQLALKVQNWNLCFVFFPLKPTATKLGAILIQNSSPISPLIFRVFNKIESTSPNGCI